MTSTFDADFAKFLHTCADSFTAWPALHAHATRLRELVCDAPAPFRVAFIGLMKSGKSTLINSLIGQPLAIANVEEATATLNEIRYGTAEQTRSFTVVWKSGLEESFPIERLSEDWSGKSEEVIERIRQVRCLRLFALVDKLREFEIVDTPGAESTVDAHEDAIRDFLEQEENADAFVYVLDHGKNNDAKILETFGSDRLSSFDPYNCIGVLHRWDGLAHEEPHAAARFRAKSTYLQLKNKLLTILPISAPLGLASRHAPDDFFLRLLDLLRTQDHAVLAEKLESPGRWNEDPVRQACREIYPTLPRISFQMLVSHYLRQPPETVSQARTICLSLSCLPELEDLLHRHFFANARIIKQCRGLKQAKTVIEPAIRYLHQFAESERRDIPRATRAATCLTEPELTDWARRQATAAAESVRRTGELTLKLDREWQVHQSYLEGLQRDLQVLRHLHDPECVFDEDHHEEIRAVCQRSPQDRPSAAELAALNSHYRRSLRFQFDPGSIAMTEHVLRRLDEARQAPSNSELP